MSTLVGALLATLVAAPPADAAAELTLSPSSGPAGTTVEVSGCGFSPEGSPVRIWWWEKEQQIGSATPDAGGCLDGTATIPSDATVGAHPVGATGTSASADASFTVTEPPSAPPPTPTGTLEVAPNLTHPGDTVRVSGCGYGATVTVTWDDGTDLASVSSRDGCIEADVRIPPRAATGSHMLTARGGAVATTEVVVDTAAGDAWPEPDGARDGAIAFAAEHAVDTGRGPGTPSTPTGENRCARLAGPDRYATAVAISQATRRRADTVVIARGDDYADALSGASLAAALDAPILLTGSAGLHPATATEVRRLEATRAILLGGTAALARRVADDLRALDVRVDRIAGRDRFDTAGRVAQRVGGNEAFVVEGAHPDPARGWPDGASVSGLSAFSGAPILLVLHDTVPEATARAVADLGVQRLTIVGGRTAVSREVQDTLAGLVDRVDRVAGADRYATSSRLADRSRDAGLGDGGTWLVTGGDWPDSVVAGSAAASRDSLLLMVPPDVLSGASEDWLVGRTDLGQLRLVGGDSAIGPAAGDEACALAESPQGRGLRRLREASTAPVSVTWEDGRPGFVSMRVPMRDTYGAGDPVYGAVDFVERFADLYDMDAPGARLFLDRITTEDADGARLVVFGQQRFGIPVYGAQIAVHVRDGAVEATDGAWLAEIPWVPAPELAPAQAEDLAIGSGRIGDTAQVVGETHLEFHDPRLFVPVTDGRLHLAWRMTVRGEDAETGTWTEWDVLVDAHTGEVLQRLAVTEEALPPDFEIYSANNNNAGTSCWNSPFAPDTLLIDEDGNAGSYSGNDADAEDAKDFLEPTYRYFRNVHNRSGWDGDDVEPEVYVHYRSGWQNAQYRPGCDQVVFGDSYITQDILAHEYTHGMIDYTSDLVYRNQSGALNESFADIFGELVEEYDATAEWLHGEDRGNANRSLADPPAGGDPDHMVPSVDGNGTGYRNLSSDNGGVHTNSGIPNKVAYLLASGGTHNGFPIDGIGVTKLGRLSWYVMTHLPNNASFARDASATVDRAERWAASGSRGFTRQDGCDVRNAFASVGLANGDLDCNGTFSSRDQDDDGISDDRDNCPGVVNPGWRLVQRDADGDGLGDACDPDSDGDGVPDQGSATQAPDNCPLVSNRYQQDADGDGVGNACDDEDGDLVLDHHDNCPTTYNPRNAFDANGNELDPPAQRDLDGDGVGDACDPDADGDGIPGRSDNAPTVPNPSQADTDGDGVGDVADSCPQTRNPGQVDTDGDGRGDACDDDDDGDAVDDVDDNCPQRDNPRQTDTDGNGIGTPCDAGEGAKLIGDVETAMKAARLGLGRPAADGLPLRTCSSRCPDWFDPTAATTVSLTGPTTMQARIVDRQGHNVVGPVQLGDDGTALSFTPDPAAAYTSPVTGDAFHGQDYRLELLPATREADGTSVTFDASVMTRGVP